MIHAVVAASLTSTGTRRQLLRRRVSVVRARLVSCDFVMLMVWN